MLQTFLQGIVLSVISYAIWIIIRPFVVKSPLSNVPGPARQSWLKGNFSQLSSRKGWQFHRDIIEKYGGAIKIHGLLGTEQIYVSDPGALHYITLKEQHLYDKPPNSYAFLYMSLGMGLLATKGEHHRRQRKMLNPVFSLRHMRDLVPIFYPIAHRLREVLTEKIKNGEEEINVHTWMSRAALEYICLGGMGYKMDALEANKKSTYNEAVKMFLPTLTNLIVFIQFSHHLRNLGTPWLRKTLLKWIPWPDVQRFLYAIEVMDKTSTDIYEKKKEALKNGDEAVLNQLGRGKDIMALLLKANIAADDEDKLPEEEIIGQMNTFIFAGHDTTTSALSRILHVLTMYPKEQEKLREEVTKARKEHGDLDYDTLMGLPYLDAFCREVLRVYPPVTSLNRQTAEDVVLPLQFPIKSADGRSELREIPLKKNTRVFISIIGANRNKAVWGEDADEFKPERWLNKSPSSVQNIQLPGVYSSMMTFHGGSRACIGFKFSELEMKLVLSILVEAFHFSLAREIEWNLGGIQTPVVKGSNDITPCLPLILSLVQPAS